MNASNLKPELGPTQPHRPSRREFLVTGSKLVAGSALAGVALPHVHAAADNTIRLALIGCGGRGTGAVANAMSAGGLVLGDDGGTKRAVGTGADGPIKLVTMADLRQAPARDAGLWAWMFSIAPDGSRSFDLDIDDRLLRVD